MVLQLFFFDKYFFFSNKNSLRQICCFKFRFSHYFSSIIYHVFLQYLYTFLLVQHSKIFQIFSLVLRKGTCIVLTLYLIVQFVFFRCLSYNSCFLLDSFCRTFVLQRLFNFFSLIINFLLGKAVSQCLVNISIKLLCAWFTLRNV